MNIGVCLIAFDCRYIVNGKIRLENSEFYTNSAVQRILKLKEHNIKNITILTNKPEKFNNLDIDVINYDTQKYSFADKLTVCYLALKKYETVIYLDSDCEINYDEIEKIKINEGITISQYWCDGKLKFFEDISHDIYFKKIIEYCDKNKLNYLNSLLLEERLIIIKKCNKIDEFFELYFKLKTIIEENDEEFNNYPIGRGEGLIMGIAIINTGIECNEITEDIKKLKLIHLPYAQ